MRDANAPDADAAPTPDPIAPDLLMLAYRSGIFPMSDSRDDPDVFWVEPRRRGILPLDGFRCAHSLAKTLRKGAFTVTCNAAFDDVIEACAAPRRGPDGGETWISHRIADSYRALHRRGEAHSIEVWQAGELAGGLYGVGFDRVFCGESMFSRVRDSSKVALAWLVAALRIGGVTLLDCQFLTDHLASMGAIEITRADYMQRLARAQAGLGKVPAALVRLAQAEAAASGDDDQLPGTSPASPSTGTPDGGAGTGGASGVASVPLALPEAFAALLAGAKSAGFSSSPGYFIAQSLTQTS